MSDTDWREAYNQLCSDLAYAMGMSGASLIGDYQVKAGVKALRAEVVRLRDESARCYSQGVEDMREKAARTVRAYSDDLDELAGEIHDATLTGDEAKTYPPGMSWLKVFDEEKGPSPSARPAPRDSDLIQQVRHLVKRYGAPAIAAEAARQAQR